MNLTDIRTRVSRAIGLSTSETTDLALIDSWANEAVEQLLRDTKVFVTTQTIALTAGVDEYELSTSMLSFKEIWLEPSNGNQAFRLNLASVAEIVRMRLVEGAFDTTPRYFAIVGANKLLLYPAPENSSDVIQVFGVPKPASSLTAGADSPAATAYGGIPTQYHTVLESYVKWKAAESEEHKPSEYGLKFHAEWERGCAKIRQDMSRKSGPMAAPARWGRRTSIPASPGIDVG